MVYRIVHKLAIPALDARHVAELQAIIAGVERCVLPKPGESFDDYRQRVEARS